MRVSLDLDTELVCAKKPRASSVCSDWQPLQLIRIGNGSSGVCGSMLGRGKKEMDPDIHHYTGW